MCDKPKKLRKEEYKLCLNTRTIAYLLDSEISCNIDKSNKKLPMPSRNTFRFAFWNYTFAIVFSVTDNRNKSNVKVTPNKSGNKFRRPYGRGIFRDGQARPTSPDTSIHGITAVVLRRNNKSAADF